ncbi:MAG: Ig and FN3 domain-containing protein, partial [Verrucomicrobiae bacterium]|nr:Ig and FN3 domain-containing protein [Verrucomicrobiae bacterium]
ETLVQGVMAAGKLVVAGEREGVVADLGEFIDFIQEPESQHVSQGAQVEFIADFLSSAAEPSLQWQRNGMPIPGATEKTLLLEAVHSADAGEYRLSVTNEGQTWYGPAAFLTLDKQQQPPVLQSAMTRSSYAVTLEWQDNSGYEEIYLIERRESGSETWVAVANLAAGSTHYIDRNLTPETAYQYRISAVAGDDVVSVSSEVVTTLEATNLKNLSTRGLVGQGDDVMIGGFVIPEGPAMSLYLRGLGPSLQGSGISNTISDPHLRLVQSGVPVPLEIVNDDWMDSVDYQAIADTGLPPIDEAESAMLVTLPPGAYTAVLSNNGEEAMAVGMVEIYDITADCGSCRLKNLSTRGVVRGGDELMIGGLIIRGAAEKQILVRGLGPSLAQVEGTLADPVLRMVTGTGEAFTLDDWTESNRSPQFAELGLPMTHEKEVAEIYQVPAGSYTFLITGQDGSEGVALLEIYEVD